MHPKISLTHAGGSFELDDKDYPPTSRITTHIPSISRKVKKNPPRTTLFQTPRLFRTEEDFPHRHKILYIDVILQTRTMLIDTCQA